MINYGAQAPSHSTGSPRSTPKAWNVAEYTLYAVTLAVNFLPWRMISLSDRPVYVSIIVFALAVLLLTPARNPAPSRTKTTAFLAFAALLAYSLLSLIWSSATVDLFYLIAPILSAFLAMAAASRLSGGTSPTDPERTLFIFACLLVLSTLTFAVRDLLGSTGESYRLATHMGSGSVVYVPLILALGIFFGCLQQKARVFPSLVFSVITIALVLLTQSRAGIISVALLIILLSFRLGRSLYGIVSLAILGLATFAWLDYMPLERSLSLDDSTRITNYESGFNALQESAASLFFGQGSGSIWPWYYSRWSPSAADAGPGTLLLSEHGPLLRHPHSLPVGVLVETGVVGFCLLLISIGSIVYFGVSVYLRRSSTFFGTVGLTLAISALSFVTEYHILSHFSVAFVWWFVAFHFLQHGKSSTTPAQGRYEPSRDLTQTKLLRESNA